MRNAFLAFLFLIIGHITIFGQSKDEAAIRKILSQQTEFWNQGDVEGFMQGYWKNDSLVFIGKSGLSYGWQTALNNYKKGYPDTIAMGKLDFTILQVKRLSSDYYYLIGKFHLARTIGDLSGHFDLLFRKINNQWVIISDHSS